MGRYAVLMVMSMAMAIAMGTDVGINYGNYGNNLPHPLSVSHFLTTNLNYTIPLVRLFDPDQALYYALGGTKLVVTTAVRNEDLPRVASSLQDASDWLEYFLLPFNGFIRFRYIAVGNEAIPGPYANYVLPAMRNIQQVLRQSKGTDYIQVTTVVGSSVLGASFPPSAGQFSNDVSHIMDDVSYFIYHIGSPLLINVYPYFAYVSDITHISLDYALFQSSTPVKDGHLNYYNLFDAMVDAFVAAMVRVVGREDVKVVISETGWPTAGNEPYSSTKNAQIYNNNLIKHVKTGGTPRRPDMNLETYIYALFNEDKNPTGVKQHFGTFYPNLTEVYPLYWC